VACIASLAPVFPLITPHLLSPLVAAHTLSLLPLASPTFLPPFSSLQSPPFPPSSHRFLLLPPFSSPNQDVLAAEHERLRTALPAQSPVRAKDVVAEVIPPPCPSRLMAGVRSSCDGFPALVCYTPFSIEPSSAMDVLTVNVL